MNPSYNVRYAELADAPRLAVLAAQVWMHTYATQGVSASIADYVLAELTPQAFVAKLSDPANTMLVAERDAHLLGLGVVRLNMPCASAPTATVELSTLYVLAHYKGLGIGSRLLKDAQALAAAQARSPLWLTVNAQNLAAINFYMHHHFQRVGTAYFVLGGVAHKNLVMLSPPG